LRILQVQNRPRYGGGANNVFDSTLRLLVKNRHQIDTLERFSAELGNNIKGKLEAFISPFFSPSIRNAIYKKLYQFKPDIIHVHDLFPLLVQVLPAARRLKRPVVMTCHNFRLSCPALFHLCHGHICELCVRNKEYWCIFKNCRNNFFESTAFSIQNIVTRWTRVFLDNVTFFITPTEFVKSQLIKSGLPMEKIVVLPNMIEFNPIYKKYNLGDYVAFVGRFSPEKGIEALISAARNNPDLPFRVAGDFSMMSASLLKNSPNNIEFIGPLSKVELADFYGRARFLVIPSLWFETFCLVGAEAMSFGKPVIASNIGALSELVIDGETGLLFEPGNVDDLTMKIKFLWENKERCLEMGKKARYVSYQKYNENIHYSQLIKIYNNAILISKES